MHWLVHLLLTALTAGGWIIIWAAYKLFTSRKQTE